MKLSKRALTIFIIQLIFCAIVFFGLTKIPEGSPIRKIVRDKITYQPDISEISEHIASIAEAIFPL